MPAMHLRPTIIRQTSLLHQPLKQAMLIPTGTHHKEGIRHQETINTRLHKAEAGGAMRM